MWPLTACSGALGRGAHADLRHKLTPSEAQGLQAPIDAGGPRKRWRPMSGLGGPVRASSAISPSCGASSQTHGPVGPPNLRSPARVTDVSFAVRIRDSRPGRAVPRARGVGTPASLAPSVVSEDTPRHSETVGRQRRLGGVHSNRHGAFNPYGRSDGLERGTAMIDSVGGSGCSPAQHALRHARPIRHRVSGGGRGAPPSSRCGPGGLGIVS